MADLEAAWNDRFLADFGVAVDRPAHGMLQDVHWSVGLFGYFPTYALGNVYAGCLLQRSARRAARSGRRARAGRHVGRDRLAAQGLQRHGGLYPPREVVARACDAEPTEGPLLDYLEDKYRELYRL